MKTIQSKILFVVITALIVITAIVTTIALTITHEIMHKDADRILNNVSQKELPLHFHKVRQLLSPHETQGNCDDRL